jgi:hypothetical protein
MKHKDKNGLTHVIGLSSGGKPDEHEWAASEVFEPNQILDGLIGKMRLENDAALAGKLQVIQPIIRMIREGSLTMSQPMLVAWIQEATGISTDELRELIRNARPGA